MISPFVPALVGAESRAVFLSLRAPVGPCGRREEEFIRSLQGSLHTQIKVDRDYGKITAGTLIGLFVLFPLILLEHLGRRAVQ